MRSRTAMYAAALFGIGGCSSGEPKQTFGAAVSAAAAAHMLVVARVNGHTTQRYTERLLESERQEAHTLASELQYELIPPEHRVEALDAMSRLEKVLDEVATDASAHDARLLGRHAPTLDSLERTLDSLSSDVSQR